MGAAPLPPPLPLLPVLSAPAGLLPLPVVDGVAVGVLVAVGTGLNIRSYGLRAIGVPVGVSEGVAVTLRSGEETAVAMVYGTVLPFSSDEGVGVTLDSCAGVAVAVIAALGGAALIAGCGEKLKFLAQAVKVMAQTSARIINVSP